MDFCEVKQMKVSSPRLFLTLVDLDLTIAPVSGRFYDHDAGCLKDTHSAEAAVCVCTG